jgi:single-strand DNA-binding protein
MEQINKIELRGNVGNVHLQNTGDKMAIRFSMATNYFYKGKNGEAVIETTWHNITAWESKNMPDFSSITKGTTVHVYGRIKSSKYKAADGTERQSYEIISNRIVIEEDTSQEQF